MGGIEAPWGVGTTGWLAQLREGFAEQNSDFTREVESSCCTHKTHLTLCVSNIQILNIAKRKQKAQTSRVEFRDAFRILNTMVGKSETQTLTIY